MRALLESLALWVEVSGTIGGAYTYDMYFQAASDAGPDAWTGVQEGLTIVVPARQRPEHGRLGARPQPRTSWPAG